MLQICQVYTGEYKPSHGKRYQRQCIAIVRRTLNLAIGHACREPLIRKMLSTVQTIAFALDDSAKRLLAFQESLDQNVQVREEMNRCAKLRTLCETRWASRADALYIFRAAFPVVV